jgi:hypothetical protein
MTSNLDATFNTNSMYNIHLVDESAGWNAKEAGLSIHKRTCTHSSMHG